MEFDCDSLGVYGSLDGGFDDGDYDTHAAYRWRLYCAPDSGAFDAAVTTSAAWIGDSGRQTGHDSCLDIDDNDDAEAGSSAVAMDQSPCTTRQDSSATAARFYDSDAFGYGGAAAGGAQMDVFVPRGPHSVSVSCASTPTSADVTSALSGANGGGFGTTRLSKPDYTMSAEGGRFGASRKAAVLDCFGAGATSNRNELDKAAARQLAGVPPDFGSHMHRVVGVPAILGVVALGKFPTFEGVTSYLGPSGMRELKRERAAREGRQCKIDRADFENTDGQRCLFLAGALAMTQVLRLVVSFDVRTSEIEWRVDDASALLDMQMLNYVALLTAIGASTIGTTHLFKTRTLLVSSLDVALMRQCSREPVDVTFSRVNLTCAIPAVRPLLVALGVELFRSCFPRFMERYGQDRSLCSYVLAMTLRCFACRKAIPFVRNPAKPDEYLHERVVSKCGCGTAIFCSHACINNVLLNDRDKGAHIELAIQGKRVDALTMNYLVTGPDGQGRGRHSLCPTCVDAYPYGFASQTIRVSMEHHLYCLVDPCTECQILTPLPLALNPRAKLLPIMERVRLIREYWDAHAPNTKWDPALPKPTFASILALEPLPGASAWRRQGTSGGGGGDDAAAAGGWCESGGDVDGSTMMMMTTTSAAAAATTTTTSRYRCDISRTLVTNPLWTFDRCECFVAMRSMLKPLLATLDGACLCCETCGNRAVKSSK